MKQLNKLFNYMIALIVLGYGAFYFYSEPALKNKPVGHAELSSNDVEQVVNKYLKQTTAKMQKERFDSERAISSAMKQPVVLSRGKETNPADVPVSQQIWKESEADSNSADVMGPNTYEQMIMAQGPQERKRYAQEFVESARRSGFHVELSNDLTKIINVTPIRKPSQQEDSFEAFPSN